MNSVAFSQFLEYDKRIHSLDKRITKIETVVTDSKQHLATKADVQKAINTLLFWIIGSLATLVLGIAGLIMTTQGRMEDRINQRMDDRFHQLDDKINQLKDLMDERHHQLRDLIIQTRSVPAPAESTAP